MGKREDSPGNKLLRAAGPRVTAGNLARCLPCRYMPTAIPFPQPWSWVDWMGASVSGAGLKPWWDGEGRCQAGQSQLPTKPGNGNSEPPAIPAQEVRGLPARPPPLALSALRSFRSLTESSHHGQSPSLVCGHRVLEPGRLSSLWSLCPAPPASGLPSIAVPTLNH